MKNLIIRLNLNILVKFQQKKITVNLTILVKMTFKNVII